MVSVFSRSDCFTGVNCSEIVYGLVLPLRICSYRYHPKPGICFRLFPSSSLVFRSLGCLLETWTPEDDAEMQ